MIAYKWKRGEEKLAQVSVSWMLTPGELAGLIIAGIEPHTDADLEKKRTKAELEAAVRGTLERKAEARNWWQDSYQDYRAGDPTVDEVEEWGRKMAEVLTS